MSLVAFKRVLEIKLYSSKFNKYIYFGTNYKRNIDDLNINVAGTKYLSSVKDTFTISISNLTFEQALNIIEGEYKEVSIKVGYERGNVDEIFKGYVVYISNKFENANTNNIIILCGNKMLAQYGQKKLNLNLKKGYNMYGAINFILRRSGITNSRIDPSLNNRIIDSDLSIDNETIGSFIDSFSTSNNFYSSGDSSSSKEICTLINPLTTDNREIKLNSNKVVLVNGYPTLTSDGISFSTLPTFNYKPLDVICIDNSILDISILNYSSEEIKKFNHIDPNGKYLIYQLDYSLNNRKGDFYVGIKGKSKNIYSKLRGAMK